MKKRFWFFVISLAAMMLISVSAFAAVTIDSKTFPDANFRNFVSELIDTNQDGILCNAEINSVTEINCEYCSIRDLTGIEVFTKLEYLTCRHNLLTKLNLSKNTALVYLDCSYNSLKSLNISKSKKLTRLICSENIQLTNLDVSASATLTKLVKETDRTNNGFHNDSSYIYVDPAVTVKAGSYVSKALTSRITAANGIYDVSGKVATFVMPAKGSLKTLVIQDTVKLNGKTYKVTAIGYSACENMTSLTKVTIGKNVKSIGWNAFYGCVKLKTVLGGEAVESIGRSAFSGCTSLKAITLNSKVKGLGQGAFAYCTKLKTITILTKKLTASSVGYGAFTGVKATVKCPSSKLKTYKIILTNRGQISSQSVFK